MTTIAETTTPSGIKVEYGVEPKRHYLVNGIEVPSVTAVLDVLSKDGLQWWGMKVGVAGVLELAKMAVLVPSDFMLSQLDGTNTDAWGVEEIVEALSRERLTVNHVRDKAGDRGQAVHDAFELWATAQTPIDLSLFPEEQLGYAKGLKQFLDDVKPRAIASEVMVGSVEYGFAGRYDIRFEIHEECQVVYKNTPKRGAHYATLKPGIYLGDLKTSKGIYHLKHDRQLEAYELASVECGYEPTDARGVIHVSADGTYEFSRSTATAEDFLAVLEVWKSDQSMKARKKEFYK